MGASRAPVAQRHCSSTKRQQLSDSCHFRVVSVDLWKSHRWLVMAGRSDPWTLRSATPLCVSQPIYHCHNWSHPSTLTERAGDELLGFVEHVFYRHIVLPTLNRKCVHCHRVYSYYPSCVHNYYPSLVEPFDLHNTLYIILKFLLLVWMTDAVDAYSTLTFRRWTWCVLMASPCDTWKLIVIFIHSRVICLLWAVHRCHILTLQWAFCSYNDFGEEIVFSCPSAAFFHPDRSCYRDI